MKRLLASFATIAFVGAIGSAMAQQNNDITQGEMANFNHFLDNHPTLAQQLAADPSLINNPGFVSSHPGLQAFLQNHAGVGDEIRERPGQFMYREGHYEWSHGGGPVAVGAGMSDRAVARFDNGYLDEHPEVAHQLAANPQLADNPEFLATHPGLDGYLANHPQVRQELQTHPDRFMNSEWRDDQYGHGSRGVNAGVIARFGKGYLDKHPEVARQLSQDPRLADNPQFLATHPGLDGYLANHPEVRTELQQHPERFMNCEYRYKRGENSHPHPLANTDRYLDSHPEAAEQLQKNPRLVDNSRYMANHPGFHEFLHNHPMASAAWRAHPYRYMKREKRFDQHN